jgi:hypothetical protein
LRRVAAGFVAFVGFAAALDFALGSALLAFGATFAGDFAAGLAGDFDAALDAALAAVLRGDFAAGSSRASDAAAVVDAASRA